MRTSAIAGLHASAAYRLFFAPTRSTRHRRRNRMPPARTAMRTNCNQIARCGALSRFFSYSSLHAARRVFPLDVFGTVRGRTSHTSLGGPFMWEAAASIIRPRNASRFATSTTLDSATTITRSVPNARSVVPKTATHPLRIPGISPTTASMS